MASARGFEAVPGVILKLALIVVTIFFALSIGGGMMFAAPVLVPLHWLAARDAGPRECGLWALLAGLSSGEAIWMAILGLTDNVALSATVGTLTFFAMGITVLATRAAAATPERRAAQR